MTKFPLALFDTWYADAHKIEPNEPTAMAVSTVDASGQPSCRMLLLKAHGEDGFVFYTNTESRKGSDLAATPKASLLFHWQALRRQIRIEGDVVRVTDAEADAYFASRNRESQLGAWASDQSRPLPNRATFDRRFEEMAARFAGGPVPRPPYWSGYRLVPNRIEFWEDRAHRLHERRLFTRTVDGWDEGLLYP
jgi:pyridoxamine 5'-phosphate oxidase